VHEANWIRFNQDHLISLAFFEEARAKRRNTNIQFCVKQIESESIQDHHPDCLSSFGRIQSNVQTRQTILHVGGRRSPIRDLGTVGGTPAYRVAGGFPFDQLQWANIQLVIASEQIRLDVAHVDPEI
jgi:hypothetical protein